jgi:hypothetical protein
VVDGAAFAEAVRRLRLDLAAMFDELRERAPSATIVLVTYPKVANPPECPALAFDPDEAELVRSMGEELELVFLDVAHDVASRTGLLLADPYAVSEGHGPCAPDTERWVAGQVAADGFAYHPTARGHEAMAELVLAALRSEEPQGEVP